MATSRPRRVSRARYTSPIPPAPSGATIWYGPNRVPTAWAMGLTHYLIPRDGAEYFVRNTVCYSIQEGAGFGGPGRDRRSDSHMDVHDGEKYGVRRPRTALLVAVPDDCCCEMPFAEGKVR